VLVEVPVMLSIVWIVNRTRPWYERGGAGAGCPAADARAVTPGRSKEHA
jgi:ACR3 family arsenite transporter